MRSAHDTQVPRLTAGHRAAGSGATTHPPRAPIRRREHPSPAPPLVSEPRPEQDQRPIDGLGPLWMFLVASLAIVGAVVLAGAVDRWWILVPVMCIFLVSTFGVLASIMRLLRDSGDTL